MVPDLIYEELFFFVDLTSRKIWVAAQRWSQQALTFMFLLQPSGGWLGLGGGDVDSMWCLHPSQQVSSNLVFWFSIFQLFLELFSNNGEGFLGCSAIGDTCVAMQEWVAHPYAKTTLDAILPCVDPQTGANTLLQSKAIVSTIASNVDLAITIVANNNNQLAGPPLFYNQSGPAVPTLCNPYGAAPNYPDQACPTGSLTFATAPQVSESYLV